MHCSAASTSSTKFTTVLFKMSPGIGVIKNLNNSRMLDWEF